MKKIVKNPFVWAFIIGAAALHAGKWLSEQRISAPPPLLSIGEWSLTNQDNQAFGSKELSGKVVIMSMFFTRCPTICPELTGKMKAVYETFEKMRDQVHFVSVSVDPEYDTPDVLKSFMAKNSIDSAHWTVLTGTKAAVYDLAVEKMKLHIGEKHVVDDKNGEAVYDINHLAELVLIDQNGDLRGLFPTNTHELAALERAAKLLVTKGPRA